MASEIQICNLALYNIGVHSIESLSENTKQAAACNTFYDITRDAVLSDYAWGFAKKREVLALETDTYSGWDYAYAYPTDCLKAHKIYDATGEIAGRIEFEISVNNDLNKRLILTNEEDAELLYTARVTTPNLFGALFIEALSFAIAARLAQPLKADLKLRDEMNKEYALRLFRAEARDANEAHQKPDTSGNTFVDARS